MAKLAGGASPVDVEAVVVGKGVPTPAASEAPMLVAKFVDENVGIPANTAESGIDPSAASPAGQDNFDGSAARLPSGSQSRPVEASYSLIGFAHR